MSDQSGLIHALDEFKRKIDETFLPAGLAEYWKIYPDSIRLGSKQRFDVTIRQLTSEVDNVIPLNEQNISFLQHRNPIITSHKYCKSKYCKYYKFKVVVYQSYL